MDNTLHIIALWAHILGIALFVGPQFFLAFAWVPASRQIADLPTRVQAMKTITQRFGYMGGAGLVLIVVAGTYLISTWRDYYSIDEEASFTDIRFGLVFVIKMGVFAVMMALTAFHMFVVGPRLQRLMEERATGGGVTDGQLKSARMQSMFVSIAALVLVLAIMVMGAMMGSDGFAFQDV